MIEIAKKKKALKLMQNKMTADLAAGFVGALNQSTRKVEIPPLMHLYCNIVELLRLRNELILARSETAVLESVYAEQKVICGNKGIKMYFEEGISFSSVAEDRAKDYIDYVEEGPGYGLNIDLAICEFDAKLVSNLNFRHPDALKLCCTTSGLEEVRAALTYQIMQKQLLIVATRINQLLIDHHCRALSELKLVESDVTVPNTSIDISKVFNRSIDSFSVQQLQEYKTKFKSDLSNIGQLGFYNVTARKSQRRTDWIKDHRKFLSKVSVDQSYNVQAL
jgi:hypothetical protein